MAIKNEEILFTSALLITGGNPANMLNRNDGSYGALSTAVGGTSNMFVMNNSDSSFIRNPATIDSKFFDSITKISFKSRISGYKSGTEAFALKAFYGYLASDTGVTKTIITTRSVSYTPVSSSAILAVAPNHSDIRTYTNDITSRVTSLSAFNNMYIDLAYITGSFDLKGYISDKSWIKIHSMWLDIEYKKTDSSIFFGRIM